MKKILYILLALSAVALSCTKEKEKPEPKKSDPSKAPQVVATTPSANAPDAEVVDEIVITYDKPIILAPNTTISVNGVYYDEDVYVADKELCIPIEMRGGGITYTVKILSPSVKDADGNYAQDFSFSFTTLVRNNFDPTEFELAEAPVDANATAEAKALYAAMKENFGTKIYSATMADASGWDLDNAEAVHTMTGKYPAMHAFDYLHLKDSAPDAWIDYGDLTPVTTWAGQGGIVAASWHWAVPVEDPAPDPVPGDFEVVDFDNVTIGSWDAWVYVNADKFANTQVGSTINIYFKKATEASQMALKNNIDGWPGIVDESGFDYSYFAIDPEKGYFTVTVDQTILDILKGVGLIISGSNLTLTALGINPPAGGITYEDTKIEIEDIDCGNWSGYKYFEPSTFTTLVKDSRIKVHYKNAADGAQMAFKNPIDGWPGIVDGSGTDYSYFVIPAGEGDYTLPVDAVVLDILKTNGLVIGGHDYTIDYMIISIPTAGVSYDETVLDCENTDCGNWSGYKYFDNSYFTNLVDGSIFVIAYTNANGAQMGLKDPGKDGWPGLVDGAGNDYSYFVIPDGEGKYTLNIDATLAADIKASGIVIGGHDYTIVSLTVKIPTSAPASVSARKVISPRVKDVAWSFYAEKNEFNPVDALTAGHWQNEILESSLAKLAGYLQQLQDQNIPVLFRPLHEASGGWFWWGTKTGEDYVDLWKYVYNYLTGAGIHNLLWVWTSCLDDADWYPGDEYVDFIAYDWYPQEEVDYHKSNRVAWDKLLAISNHKMLTLGECGPMPSVTECLEDGAMWSWWMPWYGVFMEEPYNSVADFKTWMAASTVIKMPEPEPNPDPEIE